MFMELVCDDLETCRQQGESLLEISLFNNITLCYLFVSLCFRFSSNIPEELLKENLFEMIALLGQLWDDSTWSSDRLRKVLRLIIYCK